MFLVKLAVITHLPNHLLRYISCKFYSDRSKFLSELNHLFHLISVVEVFIIHLAHIDVCVSGNPHEGLLLNLIALEKPWSIVKDKFLQKYIGSRHARKCHKPWKHATLTRYDAEFLLALSFKYGKGIYLSVLEEWERLFSSNDHH